MEDAINSENYRAHIPPEGTSVDPPEGTSVDPPEGTPVDPPKDTPLDPAKGTPAIPTEGTLTDRLLVPWEWALDKDSMSQLQERQPQAIKQSLEGTNVDYHTPHQLAAAAEPSSVTSRQSTVEIDSVKPSTHDTKLIQSISYDEDVSAGPADALAPQERADVKTGENASVTGDKPAPSEVSKATNYHAASDDSLYVIEIDIPELDREAVGHVSVDDPVRKISSTEIEGDQKNAEKELWVETAGEDTTSKAEVTARAKNMKVTEASAEEPTQPDPEADESAAPSPSDLDQGYDEATAERQNKAAFQEQTPRITYAESKHSDDSLISDTTDPGQFVPILQSSEVEDSPRAGEEDKDFLNPSEQGIRTFASGIPQWSSADTGNNANDHSFSSTDTECLLAGFIQPSYQPICNWTAGSSLKGTSSGEQSLGISTELIPHALHSTVHAHPPYLRVDQTTYEPDSSGSTPQDADSYSNLYRSLISLREGKSHASDLLRVETDPEVFLPMPPSRPEVSKRNSIASLEIASHSDLKAKTFQKGRTSELFKTPYADGVDEAIKDVKLKLQLLGVTVQESRKGKDVESDQTQNQFQNEVDAAEGNNGLSAFDEDFSLKTVTKSELKHSTIYSSSRDLPGVSDVVGGSESVLLKKGKWKEDLKMSASAPKFYNKFQYGRSHPSRFQEPKRPSQVIHMEGQEVKKSRQTFIVPHEVPAHQLVMRYNTSPADVRKLIMTKLLRKQLGSFNEDLRNCQSETADESRDSGIAGDYDQWRIAVGAVPPHFDSTPAVSKFDPAGFRLSAKEEEELTYRDDIQIIMRGVGMCRGPDADLHQIMGKVGSQRHPEEACDLRNDSLEERDGAACQVVAAGSGADEGRGGSDDDGKHLQPLTVVSITDPEDEDNKVI